MRVWGCRCENVRQQTWHCDCWPASGPGPSAHGRQNPHTLPCCSMVVNTVPFGSIKVPHSNRRKELCSSTGTHHRGAVERRLMALPLYPESLSYKMGLLAALLPSQDCLDPLVRVKESPLCCPAVNMVKSSPHSDMTALPSAGKSELSFKHRSSTYKT